MYELRIYSRDGAKRFVLWDPERFVRTFSQHLEQHGNEASNAALEIALDAAIVQPDDPEDYYAPPGYFKLEVLLRRPRPMPPWEERAAAERVEYERRLETPWGRALERLA